MCCISGLLVMPFVVADLMCAGSGSVALRVRLISATFVVCGIATLLQTTFGLRFSSFFRLKCFFALRVFAPSYFAGDKLPRKLLMPSASEYID